MMKFYVILIFLLTLILGCTKTQKTGESPTLKQTEANNGIVAKINDRNITDAEVEKKIIGQLFSMQERIYEMKKDAIDEIINDFILKEEAKKQNKKEEELMNEYTASKVTITDDEVVKFYERVKDNPRLTGTEEEKKNKIKELLLDKKKSRFESQYLEELRKNYKIEITLPEPTLPEINVEVGDSPVDGPKDAPVTIVEFSDYECPFCSRMEETIQNLKKRFPNQIAVVFRDFPLTIHENAEVAALAANCANEQAKFWEYHNLLFEKNRERKEEMVKDNLIKWAEGLGINLENFKKCIDEKKFEKAVKDDINYGKEIGVAATPTIFINGKMISGSKPFSYLENLIQKEIDKKNPPKKG